MAWYNPLTWFESKQSTVTESQLNAEDSRIEELTEFADNLRRNRDKRRKDTKLRIRNSYTNSNRDQSADNLAIHAAIVASDSSSSSSWGSSSSSSCSGSSFSGGGGGCD